MGTFRMLWVAPHLGALVAVSLELPVILSISWFLCSGCVRRFHVASRVGPRIWMGAVAFGVLMSAGRGLAIGAFGKSLAARSVAIRTARGFIGEVGQIVFALLPVVHVSRGPGEV